jgi:hypothetical protein
MWKIYKYEAGRQVFLGSEELVRLQPGKWDREGGYESNDWHEALAIATLRAKSLGYTLLAGYWFQG